MKGRWTYLYRAVDFLLSARPDAAAAKRFFRKALTQPHTVNPRTVTVDKNRAYPKAVTKIKDDAELWRRSRLCQAKYLNRIVEQDHRRIKRLIRPGLGFGGFRTARRKLAGFFAMAMIRRGKFDTSAETTSKLKVITSWDCSGAPPDRKHTDHSGDRPRLKLNVATEPTPAVSV